ncbi:MAG: FAD-binding protein [Gammaproteobacteria bacterium]|nr:FAD-binding protein [Gammaproteobacteria bacterium]
MTEIVKPDSEEQLVDLVHWALAEKKRLAIEGQASNRGFAYESSAEVTVSMLGLHGIIDYQPEELVMTARAGTSRAVIDAALAEHRQHLAFEPPAFGPLDGRDARSGSIGGVFMANLSGPRRFTAGAARDHLLGVRGVSGRGEAWKSGGRVIKNVTGYDLSKLMAGSWGTLSALTELTFKVLPAPPLSASLLLPVAKPRSAFALMSRLARNASQPSGLAFLSAPVAAKLEAPVVASRGENVCVARVEGTATAVRERVADLRRVLRASQLLKILDDDESRQLWSGIRDIRGLGACPVIIRITLPPFRARELVAEWLGPGSSNPWFADAAGGCLWMGVEDSAAVAVVGRLRRQLAGTANVVVFRAPDRVKRAIGVFPVQPAPLASLTRRIKQSFDPEHILNAGRLAPL